MNAIWPSILHSKFVLEVTSSWRGWLGWLVRAIDISEEHQFWWWLHRFHEPPVVNSGRYERGNFPKKTGQIKISVPGAIIFIMQY